MPLSSCIRHIRRGLKLGGGTEAESALSLRVPQFASLSSRKGDMLTLVDDWDVANSPVLPLPTSIRGVAKRSKGSTAWLDGELTVVTSVAAVAAQVSQGESGRALCDHDSRPGVVPLNSIIDHNL